MLKYEDLLTDTFTELKKVYEFIGVEISEDELKNIIDLYDFKKIPQFEKGPGKFNRSASLGGWRQSFNSKEQDLMHSIMKKTLNSLGYE